MPNTDNLTVLILAAGYGRRMGPFSRMVNKSLIPYDNKPLISHIMEKFDPGTKFVVACGHMGQQVKDYVSNVHSDKNVVFVDIDNYAEGDTGPATTIQMCAEHLQGGFLWLACDTLFDFDYRDRLDHNWIGVHPVDSVISQDYCWVEREADKITKIVNKEPCAHAVDAFIGLMYVKDNEYLNNLIAVSAKETYQGFEGLDLKAHTVRGWKDFGTYEKWEELSREFTDVSFPKPNELFYNDNGKIVKYFTQDSNVSLRVARASANPGCMPDNIRQAGNFLVHDFAQGDIVYNQYSLELFDKMLDWCEKELWVEGQNKEVAADACYNFYFTKTVERLNQFRVKYTDWGECQEVNDKPVKSIDYYIGRIDWQWLSTAVDWRFIHGDLHFDNTIYDPVADKFTAIDWRTDFSGQLYGDLYYDLAKMLGGLWLNYKSVKNEWYQYYENNDKAYIDVPSVAGAQAFQDKLQNWVETRGLDWKKVLTLVPIIYLNMSPLHEAPFDKFLIALAQLHFERLFDV